MDLSSENMYDTYKDEIWKELGPLDPDWFDVLTSQMFTNEENGPDQEDLCANQEGNFKTPFDKTAVDSQFFSTPKVFRHGRVLSPEPEDDRSFTNEQEKDPLPWTATQSPYLFRMSKEGVTSAKYGGLQSQSQDSFDLLQTPQKSAVSYAKQISESLGAQIHPDISWTSSLNTPPAVPSTLILSKTDESPCPVTVSADKSIVFVRKLFPSLSNASRVGALSPKHTAVPALEKGVVSPEADHNPEPQDSPQSSLDQSGGVWRQKLPDAIEDGEIRSTVASVLDGAENVLSIFFTNSSSALRKVKTERNKRKQIIQTKENDCSAEDISATKNISSSTQRTEDQDPGKCFSSPVGQTGVTGISQWSPLSLSEIAPCTMDTSCQDKPATQLENKSNVKHLQNGADSGQVLGPPFTHSGLTKKKRKFIYTVGTQGKETQSQKRISSQRIPDLGHEVSVGSVKARLEKTQDKADCCSFGESEMQKQDNFTEENRPPSLQAKVHDLDMSQLCRDFAEDFSQISDLSKVSKLPEDPAQNNFSPSACLSALKQAKQKARQANLHWNSDGFSNRHASATDPNSSINDGTMSDSGFQSTVADTTSFVFPSSKNNSQCQSGFKAGTHRTASLSTNKGNANTHLDQILQETDAYLCNAIKESQTLDSGTKSELHKESNNTQLPSSLKGTVENINCNLQNGQLSGSLPKETIASLPSIHASGFKTASNKGIHMSLANLERAKHLFQENEAEKTFSDQPTINACDTKDEITLSHGSVKNTTSSSSQLQSSSEKFGSVTCQLTASQKADVTELCTLLEEADSQFEFTQFKTAKLKPHCQDNPISLQKADKELDPDFLTGIDFDDSFNSEAEKHMEIAAMSDKIASTNCETSMVTSESTGVLVSLAVKTENSSAEDVFYPSDHISEGTSSTVSAEPKTLARTEHSEINKQENKNPLILAVGFKTAQGNILTVSKKCLSKAKALFADIENSLEHQKSPEKQSSDIDAKTEQAQITGMSNDVDKSFKNKGMDFSGFHMDTGKDMQEVDAPFKDCSALDSNTNMSVKHRTSTEIFPGSVNHKKRHPELKNVQDVKAKNSRELKENSGPAAHHSNLVQPRVNIHSVGFENTPALTNEVSFSENQPLTVKTLSSSSCTTLKDTDSFAINELSNDCAFDAANGKNIFVSVDAVKKAESLLNEIHTLGERDKQLKEKEDALRPVHHTNQIQVAPSRNGGFQTASGKGVVISTAALKKAKSLLNDIEAVEDNISEKPAQSKMLIPCPQSRNSGFHASGKLVALSSEALQKAKALFSDISVDIPVVSDTRKSESCGFENINTKPKHNEDTLLPHNGGFQTASGKGVVISTAALKKAKSLLNDVEAVEDEISEKPAHSKMLIPCPQSRNSGFQAASGKPVALSAEALQKAKALFSDISVDIPVVSDTRRSCGFENINTKPKHNEDTLLPQNGGFQTASGKGVVISTAALKKAKSLLNDIEAVEDEISEKPAQSKMLIPCPQSRNSGFQAASGKPVALSAEALQKAKALFSDISVEIPVVSDTRKSESCGFENINTKPKHNEDTLLPQNGGFQTASGKGVAISPAALKKAKTLLGKCEEVNDKISVNPTYSHIPFPGPKSGNSRFHAASGKPVALSAEALQKAKALFSDISFSGEIPDTRNSVETQDCGEKIHCGFMTAGGATVHVSQSNLLKAKNLLKEFDEGPVSANVTQADTNVHPEFKHAEFENVHVGPVVNHENVLHPDNVEINKGAYKNTPTSTNAPSASSRENPSVMTRPLSSQMCPTLRNIGSSAFNEFSSSGEFCSAREPGNNVSVPDEVMTKANSLLNESAALKSKNKKETSPLQNCGFQTASGKGVAISSTALKKAKTLLSECEVSDKAGVKTAHFKMPGPSPPPKEIHFGFTTAGGAKVNVSQQSLLKANNLLKEFAVGDCHDSNSHSTIPHDTSKSDLAKLKDAKTTSNLNLTNSSVKDLSDKESVSQVLQSFPSLQKTDHANETLRIQDSSAHDFISMKDEAPTVFHRKEGKMSTSAVDNWHDTPLEEMKSVLDYEKSKSSFNDGTKSKRTEDSSFLLLQSLDLRGCTETQQMFFAQEALDCTKALLEDEGLAEQNLSGTLENVPQQDCQKSSKRPVKEQKERGKRPGEDLDMTGQPPLKRRLLEEFDRTVDGPRGSTLHPEKSCPKGIMNDRSVFKYSDSLHANITKPHRSGTNYVQNGLQKAIPKQNSTPGDTRPARGKMPAFAPPFHKNTKIQTLKNTVVSDNIKTPLFIPPFKKQRTIVQESSSKAQQEALHPNSFVTPANSNTYVPLTKQSESTKDSTGNKSKNDIQTVTLADTTNDNLMTNQKLPIGCEPEDSITEALGAEDTVSRNQDMFQNLENVEFARDMQDMRIRKKKRQTIRPLPGSLFLTKTSGLSRISLKAAVNGKPPARYTQKQLYGYGVQQYVSEITSETAEKFRFSLQQFLKHEAFKDCGGVQLADGGWLITSNDGTAGKEEFYRALCDTPGVDPKLISEEWVYNHYRWIVWKQASMERSFPETMGSLCLTPEQVLLQLKYRYDVEVDNSQRPALRKIMERDDAAAKTLVLCVCGIVSMGHSPNKRSRSDTKTPQGANTKVENQSAVVWLTDGWYAIKAQLDEPLTAMLHKGRLAVGGKLIIYGAQLVGSQDACSPLEAPESLMLKICANSTRPARWDTKLGFYRDPRPFLLPVSCLYSNGGPVGCVDIIILRSYPIQWMERKSDGGIVFRSVRAEEKEARRYNSLQQKAMETLFAKIQAEFEREEKVINKPRHRRRTTNHRDIASLQDGEELYEAMGDDPAYLEAHLSERQLETLRTYRCSLMEKKQAELQDRYRRALEAEDSEGSCLKRDVTPVWRLCIADSIDQPSSFYQLNLWRPSSDLQTLLKEGCRYKVFNLSTSDGKKRSGIETIQLTGTKKTQFQDLQTSQEWLSARFQPRESTSFVDLQNTEFQPLCGEVDITGYVISVIDAQGSSPAFYLVDGKLNFVKVRCFSSLSQSGLEDVVKSRVFLALSNLQLRGQSTSPTPVVYAGDLTVFSTNPKEGHLQESLSQLRSLVQGFENFYQAAEEKLSHLIKSNGLSSISSPALQPRTPRQDTKSVLSQQPVRGRGFSTPVSRNVPATTSSMEKDPRSLKRRRALDYLSRIPSPPGLSCLSSMASPCVNKTFNPPRRSGTTSTLKTVQTPVYKPVTSPVDDEWVNDEELAMIDTQALCDGVVNT